ncbi:Ubiquitin_carboxyl-terminal hydrolase family protein [Hexamita inflata]|uniref:Ubiquitin_carboxyl-terminal hydrolase family protein n=1 Tax=Hexamita inflata TaxID=28002 RepID=A0ABP1GDB7_9EUKA
MHTNLKSIQEKLQASVSEYKFVIKKPPGNYFNTFTTKVNPRLQNIFPNYQPPKLNGEKAQKPNGQEPLNGGAKPNDQKEAERGKKEEENAQNKNELKGKINSLQLKLNLHQTKLEKTISTKQNEIKKNIIQLQKILVNNKKKQVQETEKVQENSYKIKQKIRTILGNFEENQQILSQHHGLDSLKEKDTSMLNALLQAIYNTDAGYNAILRGPNDKEVIERIEKAGEHDYIDKDDQSVISALQLIFLRLIYSKKQAISTVKFCKAYGIDTGKQEDANELLKNILDKLERASKAFQEKELFTRTVQVYKETFECQAGQTVKCQQCQNESLTQKPLTDLMMPVEEDFFKCFAAMLKLKEVDHDCAKCKKRTKALVYSSVQSVPDLLCMTLKRFHNKDNKQVRFPTYLDLEFIKNCNLGEIGSNSTVTEMAELLKMVMMPWLFFKYESRNITVKDKAAEILLQNKMFVEYLKIYYREVNTHDMFTDSDDELLKLPEFNNTPLNLYMLKTIVRQSSDHFQTIALLRPNMVERFQILKFDNQIVQIIDKKAKEISAGENCKFFYQKYRNYDHGSSYNLSNAVHNSIAEESRQ